MVPATRIVVRTPPPSGPGTVFVARTGVGPLAFDDPMEVTFWQAPQGDSPARCRLDKRGRLVTGWAEIEVHPEGGGGTRVAWREDIAVRGLPRFTDPVLLRAARWMFGRAVRQLLE